MKVTKKKHSQKKRLAIVIVAIILGLAAAGAGAYAIVSNSQNTPSNNTDSQSDNTPNDSPATEDSASQDKQDFLDAESNTDEEKPSQEQSSSISLSARSQGNTVIVTTKLNGVPSGECNLTVTSGGESISRSADVIYNAEYSTCAGFTISKSDLPAGTWTLDLSVDQPSGTIKQSITFKQ